jgi:L-alanine-DL-glutamate epimerase-like enolase superfamily enzyme
MLAGGVIRFLSLLELCRKMGLRVIVSSVFESPVGLKMCANLAVLAGEPCGLGTADWIEIHNANLVECGGIIHSLRLV